MLKFILQNQPTIEFTTTISDIERLFGWCLQQRIQYNLASTEATCKHVKGTNNAKN